MIIFFVFLFGIVIGSFLNVCICRIPRGESISFPPSHCMSCGHKLAWYDLFPVLSFLFLRGRCRYCKEKISIRYPLIESITGILFISDYLKFGLDFNFFKFAVLICFLIVVGVTDFDTFDVYTVTVVLGIMAGIGFAVYGAIVYKAGFLNYIYGASLSCGFILLLMLITKGKGMGSGDAEVCLMCGLFLGFKESILFMFLSFVIAGITVIILVILKIEDKKDTVPFVPFISIGALITIFFSDIIINYYMSLFI